MKDPDYELKKDGTVVKQYALYAIMQQSMLQKWK